MANINFPHQHIHEMGKRMLVFKFDSDEKVTKVFVIDFAISNLVIRTINDLNRSG